MRQDQPGVVFLFHYVRFREEVNRDGDCVTTVSFASFPVVARCCKMVGIKGFDVDALRERAFKALNQRGLQGAEHRRG